MTTATRAVTFSPLQLDGVGAPAVATGYYLITPTAAYDDGAGRVEMLPFQVSVTATAVTVDLPVTGPGWALKVVGSFPTITGNPLQTTEYVLVPAGSGTLAFEDLVRVDPATLSPTAAPDAAWWTALTAQTTALTAGLAAAAANLSAATSWTPLYTGALTGSTASLTTGTLTAKDELRIVVRVPSMSGADIPALRFNGDTAANYWSRYLTAATASATLGNAQTPSATNARLSGVSVATGRTFDVLVSNRSAGTKVGTVVAATGSGAAATIPAVDVSGAFEWVNTAAQITAVTLLAAGAAFMPAGTGMAIFGRDIQ